MAVNPTVFPSTVRTISDGQPVNANVTNGPISDLARRTTHLKELLDNILAGKALFLTEQSMDSSLEVGMATYLDNDLVWKPTLAALATDDLGVPTGLADSGFVGGLVLFKNSSTLGGVVLSGEVTYGSEILDVIDGPYVPGGYYLSATGQGFLTATRPGVAVFTAIIRGPDAEGVYRVQVQPTAKSVLEDHIHYRVELAAAPAGTPNCVPQKGKETLWGEFEAEGPYPGTVHTVVTEDVSQAGWLPADSSVFEGDLKPDGAKFGYNIDADPILSRLWPPVPITMGHVEINGRGASPGTVVINDYGIWWMNDCYGKGPWPIDYPCDSSSAAAAAESSSSSSLVSIEPCYCEPMRIDMWFTKMLFKTSSNMVTSLNPLDSSVIIQGCDGQEADTGNLKIGVNFTFLEETGAAGSEVIKSLDTGTLTFRRGFVVGRLRSASSNITVTGTEQDENFEQGDVVLDFLDPNAQREGTVNLVALDNVREEQFQDVLYLGFDSNKISNILCKVRLGQTTISETSNMRLSFWLLGRVAGVLPELDLSVRRIPRPDGCTPLDLPTVDVSVPLSSCTNSIDPNQYVEIQSDPFSVEPGDVVFFTLERGGDSYPGQMGVLDLGYTITAG